MQPFSLAWIGSIVFMLLMVSLYGLMRRYEAKQEKQRQALSRELEAKLNEQQRRMHEAAELAQVAQSSMPHETQPEPAQVAMQTSTVKVIMRGKHARNEMVEATAHALKYLIDKDSPPKQEAKHRAGRHPQPLPAEAKHYGFNTVDKFHAWLKSVEEDIARGKSLRSLCKEHVPEIPESTGRYWLDKEPRVRE